MYENLSAKKNYSSITGQEQNAPKGRKGGGMGIASFACGLLGLFIAGIPLGIIAIISGIIGLEPNRTMEGFATVGIILGVIAIIGALVVIARV